MPICHRRSAWSFVAPVLGIATVGVAQPSVAQQFPGLVIAQPPSAPGVGVQSPQAPAQAAPPAVAKAAPKKAAAKIKTASVADGDAGDGGAKGATDRILMLVNDEPVTSREVDQRARLMAASGGAAVGAQAQEIFKRLASSEATSTKFRAIVDQIVQQNQGKSREQIMAIIEQRKLEFAKGLQQQAVEQARGASLPKHRKDALEEVIEEKLKLQEARKNGISINDDEVNRIIGGIAKNNNKTEAQFAQDMKSIGVDIQTMKARFRAGIAWREVIRKKFSAQIQISDKDIERLVASAPGGKGPKDTHEFSVQRIVFALPGKLDQGAMARALADADGLRRKFGGCKTMETLVKDQPGAKFEASKYVKPSGIVEPQRSMLLAAKDGDMLPPQTAADGVELMAVCGRRALQLDEKVREEAQSELQSRKFEELAKRHLRDLRQDAHIENRG